MHLPCISPASPLHLHCISQAYCDLRTYSADLPRAARHFEDPRLVRARARGRVSARGRGRGRCRARVRARVRIGARVRVRARARLPTRQGSTAV